MKLKPEEHICTFCGKFIKGLWYTDKHECDWHIPCMMDQIEELLEVMKGAVTDLSSSHVREIDVMNYLKDVLSKYNERHGSQRNS